MIFPFLGNGADTRPVLGVEFLEDEARIQLVWEDGQGRWALESAESIDSDEWQRVPGVSANVAGRVVFEIETSEGHRYFRLRSMGAMGGGPPVLASPGVASFQVGRTGRHRLDGWDPDGRPLHFSATGLPARALLDPTSGILTFTPGEDQVGWHEVRVEANNGSAEAQGVLFLSVHGRVYGEVHGRISPEKVGPGEEVFLPLTVDLGAASVVGPDFSRTLGAIELSLAYDEQVFEFAGVVRPQSALAETIQIESSPGRFMAFNPGIAWNVGDGPDPALSGLVDLGTLRLRVRGGASGGESVVGVFVHALTSAADFEWMPPGVGPSNPRLAGRLHRVQIGAEAKRMPLRVLGSSVRSGAVLVEPIQGPLDRLTVMFDAPLADGPRLQETVQLQGNGALIPVRVAVGADPEVLQVDLDPALRPGTYQLVLGTGVTDRFGRQLDVPLAIPFTVGSALRPADVIPAGVATLPVAAGDVDGDGEVTAVDLFVRASRIQLRALGSVPELAPAFVEGAPARVSVVEGQTLVHRVRVREWDGRRVELAAAGPGFARLVELAGDHAVIMQPGFEDAGEHVVRVSAASASGLKSVADLQVRVLPGNRPPRLELVPPARERMRLEAGEELIIRVAAVDDDVAAGDVGNELSFRYDAPTLPLAGPLVKDGAGATLKVGADRAQVGRHSVALEVFDRDGASASVSVDVLVDASNRLPRADVDASDGITYVAPGERVAFEFSGTDPDGDAVRLRWEDPDAASALQQSGLAEIELGSDGGNRLPFRALFHPGADGFTFEVSASDGKEFGLGQHQIRVRNAVAVPVVAAGDRWPYGKAHIPFRPSIIPLREVREVPGGAVAYQTAVAGIRLIHAGAAVSEAVVVPAGPLPVRIRAGRAPISSVVHRLIDVRMEPPVPEGTLLDRVIGLRTELGSFQARFAFVAADDAFEAPLPVQLADTWKYSADLGNYIDLPIRIPTPIRVRSLEIEGGEWVEAAEPAGAVQSLAEAMTPVDFVMRVLVRPGVSELRITAHGHSGAAAVTRIPIAPANQSGRLHFVRRNVDAAGREYLATFDPFVLPAGWSDAEKRRLPGSPFVIYLLADAVGPASAKATARMAVKTRYGGAVGWRTVLMRQVTDAVPFEDLGGRRVSAYHISAPILVTYRSQAPGSTDPIRDFGDRVEVSLGGESGYTLDFADYEVRKDGDPAPGASLLDRLVATWRLPRPEGGYGQVLQQAGSGWFLTPGIAYNQSSDRFDFENPPAEGSIWRRSVPPIVRVYHPLPAAAEAPGKLRVVAASVDSGALMSWAPSARARHACWVEYDLAAAPPALADGPWRLEWRPPGVADSEPASLEAAVLRVRPETDWVTVPERPVVPWSTGGTEDEDRHVLDGLIQLDLPVALSDLEIQRTLHVHGLTVVGFDRAGARLFASAPLGRRMEDVLDALARDAKAPVSTPAEVRLRVVDAAGNEARLTSDFSHPFPVVELEDLTAGGLQLDGTTARVTIRGTVTDALADITADGRADIKEVAVQFLNPVDPAAVALAARGRKGALPGSAPEGLASVLFPVVRLPDEARSPMRPFAFLGRFEGTVTIPLWPGSVAVSVVATNLIRNVGSDSFSVLVLTNQYRIEQWNGTWVEVADPITADEIGGIENRPSTDSGLVNPVRVVIEDPTIRPDGANLDRFRIRFGAVELPLRIDDGVVGTDRPLMALARPFSMDIPNFIHVEHQPREPVFGYRGVGTHFGWAWTEHSPANHYTYAAGTIVRHVVRSPAFRRWRLGGTDGTSVSIETRTSGGGDERWMRDWSFGAEGTVGSRIESVEELADGAEPGIRLKLRLGAGSAATSGKICRLRLVSRSLNAVPEYPLVGSFHVVPHLQTLIFGVDGFAYESARRALDYSARRESLGSGWGVFDFLFRGAVNLTSPALSAMPTVTWCNWPGVYSGMPPSGHGLTGNAFFERERAFMAQPFFSWGIADGVAKLDSLRAVLGWGLTELALPDTRSLFADVARVHQPPTPLRAVSAATFFPQREVARGSPPVRLDHHAFWDPRIGTHGFNNAALADIAGSSLASRALRDHGGRVDILATYFPGPDNMAHYIGADSSRFATAAWVGRPPPEAAAPLPAIEQRFQYGTEDGILRVVDALRERGMEYSTLVALVADHGLRAFHNLPAFNLTLDSGLEAVLRGVSGLRPWPWGSECTNYLNVAFLASDVVYSPNGGSAQLYIARRNRVSNSPAFDPCPEWNRPPRLADVEGVAGAIFWEATGGLAVDPATGLPVAYPGFVALCPVLGPKPNPAFGNRRDGGALGDPPAVFVRVSEVQPITFDIGPGFRPQFERRVLGPRLRGALNAQLGRELGTRASIIPREGGWVVLDPGNGRILEVSDLVAALRVQVEPNSFLGDFRWLRFVDPGTGVPTYGTIAQFLAARSASPLYRGMPGFSWPAFEARVRELNHQYWAGSRTGDILLIMDERAGYLAVNAGEEDPGWHGGPSVAESQVPLWFSIPGDVVEEGFLHQAFSQFVRQSVPSGGLRNWHLSSALQSLHRSVRAGAGLR